jgi:hypothetical protein
MQHIATYIRLYDLVPRTTLTGFLLKLSKSVPFFTGPELG